jgi:hypothetical protein
MRSAAPGHRGYSFRNQQIHRRKIMQQKIASLLATFKTVDAFGLKYAADFLPTSVGGKQFALVHAAVPQASTLGAAQVSGDEQAASGILGKAAGRAHLRQDLLGITDAVHTLVLLGTEGLEGKFHMPRSAGDQALLNSARAFATDAVAFQADFVSVGLDADFIIHLNADIAAFEAAVLAKGAGKQARGGATGGLDDAAHKAAVALHILNTVVKNAYKKDPAKLAEWATASHLEKHTPKKRVKKTAASTPATPAK